MTGSMKQRARTCYFCGGAVHKRNLCPAFKAECRKCGKIGHYLKVCRSNNRESNVTHTAATYTPAHNLLAIASAVPDCLKSVCVMVAVNDAQVEALLDKGSSESFIDRAVATRLNIKFEKSPRKVNLASSIFSADVLGTCLVDIRLNGNLYKNVCLGVMNQLCGDVILGQDFQSKHSQIIIEFGGKRPALKYGLKTKTLSAI